MKKEILVKRIVAFVLVATLTVGICACKSSDVKAVESLIDEIGTVTFDSDESITNAENQYAALSDSDKNKVENYSVLENAREEYDNLFVNIHNVEDAIDAIGSVDIDSENSINYAEDAYRNLSSDEQALVNNLDILEAARSDYDELESLYDAEIEILIACLDSAEYKMDFVSRNVGNVNGSGYMGFAVSFMDECEDVFNDVDRNYLRPEVLAELEDVEDDIQDVVDNLYTLRNTNNYSDVAPCRNSANTAMSSISALRNMID